MSWSDYYAGAKDNWRIVLLTLFLVLSAFAVAPSAGGEGATDLAYGLELSEGTRVRAPLVGQTATGLDYGVNDVETPELEATVANELGVRQTDVYARPATGEFEVYSDNVSAEEIAAALRAGGMDVQASDVEDRVTEDTYEIAEEVIQAKLDESTQYSGGKASIQRTPAGDMFLKVEIPGATPEEVRAFLSERGAVRVDATFPEQTENGTVVRNETLFTGEDIHQIGVVRQNSEGTDYVPVTLTEEAADRFHEGMREYGYAQQDGTTCNFQVDRSNPGYCLTTWKDDQFVSAHSLHPNLARSIRNDEAGRGFQMLSNSSAEARELRVALHAGALPSDLAFDEGDSKYVGSLFSDRVKGFSLVTGLVSAIAVAVVVFVRYGNARVAAPMVATALSEVLILLGFAAAVGLALDLSHIAGFIAVIGTGVDDLVIIADEVLDRGDVKTRRVFQNRFRKAFWVIGVAAVTTIIAMLPLTVLSLGDLSGFAMVTIVGVLIGVLITRPAYGDIIRALMTRQQQ